MVFESLVADLINKYLGEFVENLDRSQLKISVMRGRVKLRNLELKKSVLDDLELPVELKAGHIENLSLTIPWTNLYSESVEVFIDGLYALAVPNVAIKYDAEREEKAKQESKQKKLLKVEEFKRAATENGTQKKEKDSFVEKLTVQIIKNLQIKIQNIHFRYEDGYTNPEHPISFGVSLADLQFHTTDDRWTPCAVKEVVNKIFKLVRINSLAVYWNANSEQYASLSNEMMFERLKEGVARKDGNFAYHFLIKPISSEAHLELNMKPELENFSLPKVLLSVTFDEIEIRLSKLQYNGILELLESFERMYLMSAYRKYRPNVPVHNQAKAWWHFARDCVLEMKVRHRHRMFSWNHINHHRSVMKRYREAYTKMLSNPNRVSPNVQNDIEECEAFLDVFSIILMRSKAEIEIERPKGMFKKKGKGKTNIKEQFEKEFSANEKAKLNEAIGYQENEGDPTFPKEYVAVRLETKCRSILLTVNDESKREPQILKLHLEGGLATLRQRPAESAVQIIGKIDNVTVDGTSQESSNVNLILSQNEDTQNLLNFNLETKPLDGECHTRVSIESRPLQIIYDAVSINNVTEFFRPPKETYLKQLSRAAIAKFKDITKKSASGLKHAIEKQKYTDIHVDIRPSYIIIPHGGRYQEGSVDILVLDLGSLTVNSAKNTCSERNQASAVEDSMSEAYENFKIDLERVQVLYARRGDNWNFVRQNMNMKSPQHVLLPISINLCLQKRMFDNNHQFPKWKMSGNLPLLSLSLSDLRLQEIIQLVQSIPLPKVSDRDLEVEEMDVFSHILDVNDDHLIKTLELAELAQKESRTGLTSLHDEACKLFMEMKFEIGKVCICLQEYTTEGEIPMISLDLLGIGTRIITKKFDTEIVAFLGEIYLRHRNFKATESLNQHLTSSSYSARARQSANQEQIYSRISSGTSARARQSANQEQIYSRISSSTSVDEGETLINMIKSLTDEKTNILTLTFHKADPKGPEFESTFQKIEQNIDITFTSLEVLLHQEALLSVMKFAAQLQQSLQVNLSSARSTMKNVGTQNKKDSDPTTAKDRQVMARKSQKNRKDKARVILRVSANLKRLGLSLWTNTSVIASGCIDGISVAVVLHDNKTFVTSELKEVAVYDYNVITMYPKIVEIKGDAVFILKLTIYNNVTEGANNSDKLCVDASVKVQIGCVRGVFLMRFVNDLLKYFTSFQVEDLKSQIKAAKKKVREASGAVTEGAKVAIRKRAKKSPLVEIDVSLDAPVIFVPERSDSPNVLMLDFGHIDIKNSFRLVQGSADISAVLDTIRINLTSTKIARVQLNKENEVIAQCLVLEPITANLSVTRNLAFKCYKKIPAVYISGQLDSIEVILSEGDCKAITTWLNENMSEGQITGSILVSSDAKNTDTNQEISKSADTDASSSSRQNQCDRECTQLKVQFNITFSSATLYSGESRLTTDGKNSRAIDQALGQFMIMGIAVECEMKNDKSTTICVLVRDAIIDDKRRKKQAAGVKRMMEKCDIDTRQRRNHLFCLQFIQEPAKTKQVNVKVCSVRLVVCLDFLMPLADFFTSAISAFPTSLSFHRNLTVVNLPSPTKDMAITMSMETPEIILIEDQMDPASNSLLLSFRMELNLEITSESQKVSACVRSLQTASAIFSEKDKHRAQILRPCDIDLNINSSHWKYIDNINISISDVVLKISPQTIRTLALITVKLSKTKRQKKTTVNTTQEWNVLSDLWKTKTLSEEQFWFLIDESNEESHINDESEEESRIDDMSFDDDRLDDINHFKHQLTVTVSKMFVELEGGVGKRTVPLLIAESSFDAIVKNWRSELVVNAKMQLKMAFYNEKLSVWEYLLEPVLENERIKMWNLDLQEKSKNRNLTSPNMSINIRSSVPMEVTVTNTCLDVLNNLVKAFGNAYRLVAPAEEQGINAPYVIKNTTGMSITLKLDKAFETPPEMKNGKITLATDKSLALYGQKHTTTEGSSRIDVTQAIDEKFVIFQIQQFGAMRKVFIKRSEKRLYPVNHRTYPGDTWAVVCSTEASIGQKILHLRSIVQMKNNLPHVVRVSAVNNDAEKMCGVVGPGEMFNVPLPAVYTEYGQFVVEPLDSGCGKSGTFSWKDAEKFPKEYITCKYQDGSDYVICVKTEIINVYDNETEELSAKTYVIHLSPSIVFHNLLNIPISLLLEGKTSEILLEYEENTPLIHVMPGKSTIEVNIPAYRDWEWHGSKTILTPFPCLSTWKLNPVCKAPKKVSLMLELHCKENQGSLEMSIYSPYWMINKTGMTLYYTYKDSESVIEHPPCTQEVVFFSFKPRQSVPQKKKALLRIDDSVWSKTFFLDTVGCSQTIQCKSKSRTYEVGIKIRLSSSGLTKICTFTPLYMLLNTSEVKLLCAETTKQEKWIQIPPKSCLPFWPVQSWRNRKMIAKVEGSDYNTEPFDFSKPHTTFMKVEDKWGGINVDCQVAEAAIVTTLTTYKPGMATVLMINSTDNTSIKYNQSDEKRPHMLNPKEYVLYTWENVNGKRELEWSFGKNKSQKTNLMEDGKGSFFLNLDTDIYWVSFLDGPQRVLLFTKSDNVTNKVHNLGFEERFEHEINISLHRIGVSLVNDTTQTEIAYLSITSSPTTWEEETRRDTYRTINVKTSENLEAEYQKFIQNQQQGIRVPLTITVDKAEVNFQEMRMIKPNNRMIRRSDHDGVWIQCKTSPRTIHVHAKINRFQVDSQTNIHAFHTVLAPVTPPTSVALDNVQKPIVEVSVVAVRHDHSDMLQFKYCKVLVQPIYVNVDNGFLNIIAFITPSQHKLQTSIAKRLKAFKTKIKEPYNMMRKELSEIENATQTDDECIYRRVNLAEVKEPHTDKKEMTDADLKMVYGELLEETGLAKEQKHFFDNLHVSPLKIIFSQSIQLEERPEVHYHDNIFLSAVLQIQNVQEVVLGLGYFEKKNTFLNISQLISQIPRHYKKQATNQIYVLLFGLDVFGNPLGLLRGIFEGGADLFYEPYQGAIQGPGEFVEGLALGVRSFVGHTVVGTAGALHRISGSVGKGLAILTFDDEYQKKRQEGLNKKPANIGEGLLRGVKGLGTGVFHGFTGIVIRPIEGAQREGVGGLFKGIGKGLVGVITRPSSGVVDFVSSSFEAIKRTADLSDEVKRIRPPRRFYSDKIIRPFNFVEATGFNFLQETEEGMFAETDEYITHCVNTGDNISTKSIFLITDRRVIYAKKGVMLGHWEAEWSYTWDDLKERPKQHDEKVEFLLKDKRRSPFQKRRSTEIIKTSDSRIAEWLVSEISKAMNMK